MLYIENELHSKGYKYIACIDEVGRGCLFGDVVACSIIMPEGITIEGVKDSKKLSEKKRESLYQLILDSCIGYGIGRVDASIIDQINIKEATRLAMKQSIENLHDKVGIKLLPDFLLIDAEKVYLDFPQEGIIKGDDRAHGIACASIVAKVFRDKLCLEWGKQFPGYKIEKHKGYGTKAHYEAIEEFGVTRLHRNTFLKKFFGGKEYGK